MFSDQTQLRSKTFLIRPKCARRGYDQTQLRSELPLIRPKCARRGYDQTQVRSNPPMIRLFRPLIRPSPDNRPDCSVLEISSRPCNFGLGTHGCALDWVSSLTNLGLDLELGYLLCFINCDEKWNVKLPRFPNVEQLSNKLCRISNSVQREQYITLFIWCEYPIFRGKNNILFYWERHQTMTRGVGRGVLVKNWLNVRIAVNAVNCCKNHAERSESRKIKNSTAKNRISYVNSPAKKLHILLRWIFLKNFAVKINILTAKTTSYKYSPPGVLQKTTAEKKTENLAKF